MSSLPKDTHGALAQQNLTVHPSAQDYPQQSSFSSDSASSSASLASAPSPHPVSPLSSLSNASPALLQVIHHINALSNGSRRLTPYWSEFYLSPEDFEELQLLEKRDELAVKKLRYDYSPEQSTFTLRMPNYEKHEVFLDSVRYQIRHQLEQLSLQDGVAAAFTRGIVFRASSTIFYPPLFSTTIRDTERTPDCGWSYRTWSKPSCILEVASSQTTKNLKKLAEEYIGYTNGSVRTVVGFDFDYRAKKGASLSVWRAQFNSEHILTGTTREVVELRNKDGIRNQDPDAGLRLSLEDFAFCRPAGTFDGLDQVSLFIPVSYLCDQLEMGEEQDSIGHGGEGLSLPPHPNPTPDLGTPTHRYALRSRR